MPKILVHPTPNPNSLKFTAEGASILPSGMLAFGSKAEAAEHELGAALFALHGVENVFALPQFLTVTKSPDVAWDELSEQIQQTVACYLATKTPVE